MDELLDPLAPGLGVLSCEGRDQLTERLRIAVRPGSAPEPQGGSRAPTPGLLAARRRSAAQEGSPGSHRHSGRAPGVARARPRRGFRAPRSGQTAGPCRAARGGVRACQPEVRLLPQRASDTPALTPHGVGLHDMRRGSEALRAADAAERLRWGARCPAARTARVRPLKLCAARAGHGMRLQRSLVAAVFAEFQIVLQRQQVKRMSTDSSGSDGAIFAFSS